MIVREIDDIELIKSVLCTPEIYECIRDDNCPEAGEFEPPLGADYNYVAGFVDGDIIGIMIYHKSNGELKCHIQVLPQYRKKYAKKFAQMALNFGKAKNASIYAEIPECFPNVLKFAKSFGFVKTGNIKDGRKVDGIFHDVAVLRLQDHGLC